MQKQPVMNGVCPTAIEKFEAAVRVIQSLPKNGSFQPSNSMLLRFYSLYKQANFGKCSEAKPGFWDIVGRAKWDAWNTLGDMSSEEAMLCYVDELKKVIETMPHTPDVSVFLEKLGNFYEMVDEEKMEESGLGMSLSNSASGEDAEALLRNSLRLANQLRLSQSDGEEENELAKAETKVVSSPYLESLQSTRTSRKTVFSDQEEEDEFCDTVDCLPPVDAGAAASPMVQNSSPLSAQPSAPQVVSLSPELQAALDRLQTDVGLVLRRLAHLETQVQQRQAPTQPQPESSPQPATNPIISILSNWFPFRGMDRRTVMFIMVWPLVVTWVLKLLWRRRSRAMRR